jgi:hypothetical protein
VEYGKKKGKEQERKRCLGLMKKHLKICKLNYDETLCLKDVIYEIEDTK